MLSAALTLALFIKEGAKFGLILSYKTGQVLVNVLAILLNGALQLYKSSSVLLKVIVEDFIEFLHDFTARLQWVGNLFNLLYQNISTMLERIVHHILSVALIITDWINTATFGLIEIIRDVGLLIAHIAIGLKELLILVGSGVWFTITFIPLSLVSCFHAALEFNQQCAKEIAQALLLTKESIIELYHFLIDVPLESIAGIIIGCSITYIIIQLHLEFSKFLWEVMILLLTMIKTQWRNLRSFVTKEIIGFFKTPARIERNEERYDIERHHCVVCNERYKSILVLPCRHLCLCIECSTRLKNYNHTCPICRTEIEDTMKVFI